MTDGTATLSSGALSGATTVTASGAVTGGSLTDGTATLSSGALSGATTINASSTITGGTLTDGTASLSSGALSGATNIDGSGDLTMGTVTMTGFSVDADGDVVSKSLDNTSGGITNAGAISGATTIDGSGDLTMGTVTMTGFSVDASGNIDLDANLDLDGTSVEVDASSAISLDAGAASNFTTSAGALTLEGAGGVTVTSTGGGLTLNGTGQTVDLDAATLDVDATTITIDATNTTFTGNVKGPKAEANDEFVTFEQLDSLANTAPYNETYKVTTTQGTTLQTITVGAGATRLDLGGAPAYQTENTNPIDNPQDGSDPQISLENSGGPNDEAGEPANGYYFLLDQTGMYQAMLSIELASIPTAAADALALVELKTWDPSPASPFVDNPLCLVADTEVVYDTEFSGANTHINVNMVFKTVNAYEALYVDVTALAEDIDIKSFSFAVTRTAAE